MGGAVALAVVAFGLLVGGPVAAFVALSRVRELERRLANLETRPGQAQPSLPPIVAPPAIPVATPVAAPIPAPTTVEPSAARPDFESVVAGRWLNRVGLLAVAVGVSFFLKYAIDNEWIGPRGQVALGLLLGAALVAWSMPFVRRGFGYFADGLAGL